LIAKASSPPTLPTRVKDVGRVHTFDEKVAAGDVDRPAAEAGDGVEVLKAASAHRRHWHQNRATAFACTSRLILSSSTGSSQPRSGDRAHDSAEFLRLLVRHIELAAMEIALPAERQANSGSRSRGNDLTGHA
jgi:hypothetical protein